MLSCVLYVYICVLTPSCCPCVCLAVRLSVVTKQDGRLTDGAGHRPAYSLRTLCRALDYARRAAPAYGLTRALWDGLSMSFLTQVCVGCVCVGGGHVGVGAVECGGCVVWG